MIERLRLTGLLFLFYLDGDLRASDRQLLRLRANLREYFPAALLAFDDLTSPHALELLGKAPDPVSAARLSRTQILAALKRARRHRIEDKTTAIREALRTQQLTGLPKIMGTHGRARVRRAWSGMVRGVR